MKLTSKFNNQTFQIIEDFTDVGFYFYVYNSNGENTHDYLQNSLKMAKEFAFEEFGVPIESWVIE